MEVFPPISSESNSDCLHLSCLILLARGFRQTSLLVMSFTELLLYLSQKLYFSQRLPLEFTKDNKLVNQKTSFSCMDAAIK